MNWTLFPPRPGRPKVKHCFHYQFNSYYFFVPLTGLEPVKNLDLNQVRLPISPQGLVAAIYLHHVWIDARFQDVVSYDNYPLFTPNRFFKCFILRTTKHSTYLLCTQGETRTLTLSQMLLRQPCLPIPPQGRIIFLQAIMCPGRDSNPHTQRYQILLLLLLLHRPT